MSEILGRLGGSREDDLDGDVDEIEIQLDARGARWLRRHLASGVVAVTTVVDGFYRGSSVTACTMVSIDPMLFLVSIERESQMEGWIEESNSFAINVLARSQQFLADQFAGFAPRASDTLTDVAFTVGVTGAPLLTGSIAWADCKVTDQLITGDHRCFVGQALSLAKGRAADDDPLIYYMNRYRRLG